MNILIKSPPFHSLQIVTHGRIDKIQKKVLLRIRVVLLSQMVTFEKHPTVTKIVSKQVRRPLTPLYTKRCRLLV